MSTTQTWVGYGIAPKPTGEGDSGFVDETGTHAASMEDIARRLEAGAFRGKIAVWTPDTLALVTAAEVPYFQDAYRVGLRRRALARRLRWGYALTTVVGIALFVLSVLAPDRPDVARLRSAAALIVALGLFSEIAPRLIDLRDSRRSGAELADQEAVNIRHQAWTDSRLTVYTWILVFGLAAMFVAQLMAGMPKSLGGAGFSASAIGAGQWWRLFTAPLVHASIWHVVISAGVVAAAGDRIESNLDRCYVPLVFLVSAVYGCVASLLVMSGDHLSVGASGGAMGLIGFLLVFARRHRAVLPVSFAAPMKMAVFFTIAAGIVGYEFIGPGVHLGGLVGGAALGALLIRERRRGDPPDTPTPVVAALGEVSMGVLAMAALIALVAMFGLVR